MKHIPLIPFLVVSCALLLLSCTGKKTSAERKHTVVVYANGSFASEWGPGPEITKAFESATGLQLDLVDCGSAGETLNRAILEKKSPQADVILGLDNTLVLRAKEADILAPYTAKNAASIIEDSVVAEFGAGTAATPYDFGHFALIYDTHSTIPAPTSLEDITKDIYKKQVILMDPRTSSTGLGFLQWSRAVFKDDARFEAFWHALKPNILSMTAGWSEGWGMFQKGEAPLVISYTTSPAYNVEYEHNDRFVSLIFEEGHVRQIEGAALLKGAANADGGKQFIDFLISTDAQHILPLTQWMYPVNNAVVLPESYKKAAPLPPKTLFISAATSAADTEKAMEILQK